MNSQKDTALKRRPYGVAAALTVVFLVALDQYTKALAVEHLKGKPPIPLVPDVFELFYLENRGAAFGILQNRQTVFIVMVMVVCVFAVYYYFRIPMGRRYSPIRVCTVFLVAGAAGNGIDRIRQGYVVDFFYFKLIDFPVFNVADIYVTCTVFALLLLIFFYYEEEDFEQLFPGGKRGWREG